MIDLYYFPTPNGWKVSVGLEEMELEYRIQPVNIGQGEQFQPEFLAISPNNRIPAIVDHTPSGGGEPISVFESGAILLYLAEKTGRFLPREPRARAEVFQWLMWQMGGLGPMLGQSYHFRHVAPERIEYATGRYADEARRLYGVLDRRLAGREFICGEYSIADMACLGWIVPHTLHGIELDATPQVHRWYEALRARPAVARGLEAGRGLLGDLSEDSRSGLLDESEGEAQ